MYCIRCGSFVGDVPETQSRVSCPRCGYTFYQGPSPCVSVLIVQNDKLLLTKRGDTSIKPGRWCLPCGHMEGSESFIDAARREVGEETALEILPLSIVNVVTNHFPGLCHSIVTVLLAEPASTSLRAGDDSVDVAWYPVNGPFPDMAFQADLHIIGQYRRYGRSFGIALDRTEIEFFE